MLYHKINPETGEYLSSRVPQEDKGRVLGPGKNEVNADLPEAVQGKARVLQDGKFIYIDDHRGKTAYKIDGTAVVIDFPGDIPADVLTFEAPPSSWHKWNGTEWVPDTSKKQAVLQKVHDLIDLATKTEIETGFELDGVPIHLSQTTQFNLEVDHRIRENLTYPYRFRTDDGTYIEIKDADQFDQFFMTGRNYVRECLENGYGAKDAVASMTTKQLIEYLDYGGANNGV